MREYGQVQCAFWQSDDAMSFDGDGQLLALYLMTGPHSNGIGCYRLPDGYLMADLSWTVERIAKAFEQLAAVEFARRIGSIVVLPKFIHWNPFNNPNVAAARCKEIFGLPKGEAKKVAAAGALRFGKHVSDADQDELDRIVGNPPRDRSGTPSPNESERVSGNPSLIEPNPTQTEPTHTQPRKNPKGPPPRAARAGRGEVVYGDEFLRFWAVYPNPKGKAEAWKSWQKQRLDPQTDALIADVQQRAKRDRGWLKEEGRFIPHGSTYVNQRGWEDGISDGRANAGAGGASTVPSNAGKYL